MFDIDDTITFKLTNNTSSSTSTSTNNTAEHLNQPATQFQQNNTKPMTITNQTQSIEMFPFNTTTTTSMHSNHSFDAETIVLLSMFTICAIIYGSKYNTFRILSFSPSFIASKMAKLFFLKDMSITSWNWNNAKPKYVINGY